VVGREIRCGFESGDAVVAVIRDAPLLPPPTREEMAGRLTTAASASFARDSNDRALELLERAIAICPAWTDAHEAAGVILGRLGRHREAIDAIHRLLEIDPSSVMAHSNLSLFHNQLGDVEQAEHHLAMATRLSRGAPATGIDRVSDDAEIDRRRREGMFLQVLEIDPDDALAHFGLGELALERERFAEAVEHLERASAGDPTHAAAILALGAAFEAQGDSDRAREAYESGVDVAAKRGDAATARKMQERINALAERAR
jgi:tetratricopeptide (TPR) repeat protein